MGSVFTLIPRPLYEFKGLDVTARYAFGLIYDRLKMSAKKENRDRFTDILGIYCVFSREEMAEEIGVSIPTLRRAIKKLHDQGLITSRIAVSGGSWRYYLLAKAKESLAMQELPEYCIYEPPEENGIVDP